MAQKHRFFFFFFGGANWGLYHCSPMESNVLGCAWTVWERNPGFSWHLEGSWGVPRWPASDPCWASSESKNRFFADGRGVIWEGSHVLGTPGMGPRSHPRTLPDKCEKSIFRPSLAQTRFSGYHGRTPVEPPGTIRSPRMAILILVG